MADELAERIANYDPSVVKGAPKYAQGVYNEARRTCGMKEVVFEK